MNYIEISGGKRVERDVVEHVVHWCLQRMMPRIKTLNIEVNLTKLDEAYGYCLCEDKRTFQLDIKKGLTLFQLITTVCHEMTHVKQYATGELKEVDYGAKWKGRRFSDEMAYSKLPWEKQAFKMEKELTFKCFEEISFTFHNQ
jgi:hypothetical protein